jgi:hypothetical protein
MNEPTGDGNAVVEAITSALKDELGDSYTIISNPRLEQSVEVHGSPDLMVKDDTGQITLIEVKVSPPDDELPFATIPHMRRLQEQNRDINANVVLVSTSFVPEVVKRSLKTHGIDVIHGGLSAAILPGLRSLFAGSASAS